MRIVFMGTPQFAAVSLNKLIDSRHNVVSVFCNPDKRAGRKKELKPPEVKVLAKSRSVPVYQPEKLRDEAVYSLLKGLDVDLIAVVAYGKFLPKEILEIPKCGCINLHGSLLPKYRGAAPIQRSIINGDELTGLTTIYLDEEMDSGDIIDSVEVPIQRDETSKDLFERMAQIGAELLLKTVNDIENGNSGRTAQNEQEATFAPPLTKKEALIHFDEPARIVHNKIRGFYDWPKGYIIYKGKRLNLLKSRLIENVNANCGELISSKNLTVGCRSGAVEILSVQLEGKKEIAGRDFMNGQHLKIHDRLT